MDDGTNTKSSHRRSSVLDAQEIEANDIQSIVISLEGGEEEHITSRGRERFYSYELYETANYIRNLSRRILKG